MSSATVLVCGGCAARFRTRRPDSSRRPCCPRCGVAPQPEETAAIVAPDEDPGPLPFDPAQLRRAARLRGLRESGLMLSLTAVMAFSAYLAWRVTLDPIRVEQAGTLDEGASPAVDAPSGRPGPFTRRPLFPFGSRPFRIARAEGARHQAHGPAPEAPSVAGRPSPGPATPPPTVHQPDDPPHQPLRLSEASSDAGRPTAADLPHLKPASDAQAAAVMVTRAIAPGAAAAPAVPVGIPSDLPRLLVGDASGRALVSRLYARGPGGPVVQLPDGSLGWPDGEVPTDRPFRPWTARQLGDVLRSGPYRGFRAIERPPYLVLTDGSDAFARNAAELLQGLYRDLTECLADGGLPVTEPEFPLVAVIHRDEAAFRDRRPIDPDVRAYYEVVSNRISLFETSEQDLRAPELAALRRPQTIAHEGVHQILQNVGIQRRLANWPAWLVEGLAEYYAPISSPTPGPDGLPRWGDYGRENFGRVNPFHMATLIDLQDPAALLAHFRGPGSGPPYPSRDRLGPDAPWITHLALRVELSPTDYALAWSLTHHLARNHPDAFRSYLQSLGRRTPLEPRTPEHDLKGLIAAFDRPPTKLARQLDRHLTTLRYDRVPYYAVRFEQAVGPGLSPRRGVLVSPSPTMISQWLRAQTLPDGGPMLWWATPFDSRNRARVACESWLLGLGP